MKPVILGCMWMFSVDCNWAKAARHKCSCKRWVTTLETVVWSEVTSSCNTLAVLLRVALGPEDAATRGRCAWHSEPTAPPVMGAVKAAALGPVQPSRNTWSAKVTCGQWRSPWGASALQWDGSRQQSGGGPSLKPTTASVDSSPLVCLCTVCCLAALPQLW